jgi:hypothetical protein
MACEVFRDHCGDHFAGFWWKALGAADWFNLNGAMQMVASRLAGETEE